MKTYQLMLTPVSSFHGFPSSDTIFGAICWGIKRIYGNEKLLGILCNYQNNPEFILSSSFPYVEYGMDGLSFYPKSITGGLSALDIDELAKSKKEKVDIITRYKKFKKAEYITSPLFDRMIKGVKEKQLFKEYLDGGLELNGKILIEKLYENIFRSLNPLFKNELVQKNSIDRLTMSTGKEGQTFYQEECFTDNGRFKLHLLLKTDNIDFLKPVFRYLEDKGIGGNRSTGKGRFKIKPLSEVSLGDNHSQKFITLSRYIPEVSEVNWESISIFYEVFPWRSKVDSESEFKGEDIWKSKVMYLKEGSCLEAKERKEFYGRVPVVKEIEGNKICQNGIAFPVFGNFGG